MGARQAAALRLRPSWRVSAHRLGAAELGFVGDADGRTFEDAGIVVVVDGHVYNRAELGFRAGDAEGLAALVRLLGFEAAMCAMIGDLAVAVHDRAADRLWLGRDRFGVKPLYWARTEDGIAFSSQPRGLLALPGMSPAVNRQFVALVAGSHYRTFDNDREASPFAAIAQLPAAHLLEAGPNGVDVRAYWDLEDAPDLDVPEDALAEQYRELILDAVRLRHQTARSSAFTLSGGMDSSTVLASAARTSGAPQHAFSSVYQEQTYDERDEIASMLGDAVAEWHPVTIEPDDVLGTVRAMVAVHDEPVATATWLSHWILSQEVAAGGFDVLFGGLGGDELNAGEYEYFAFHFADLRAAGREDDLHREVKRWAENHDHPIWKKNRSVMEDELARRVDLGRGLNLPDLPRIHRYAHTVRPEWFDLDGWAPRMDHPFRSHLKNRAHQDLFRETTPCCLRAEDRHATAVGIDHADPFLDHRLAELLFRVRGDLKIRDGITKHLLRSATRGLLPEETRQRVTKTGWNAPAHVWFSGSGGEAAIEAVRSGPLADRGVYDATAVERIVREHDAIVRSGAAVENHMMFLWQLTNLAAWFEWLEDLPS